MAPFFFAGRAQPVAIDSGPFVLLNGSAGRATSVRRGRRDRGGVSYREPPHGNPAMLPLAGRPSRLCSGPTRREFLRVGGLTVGGLSLPTLLANGWREPAGVAKAKSCLLI